jgi:hypothetical protein
MSTAYLILSKVIDKAVNGNAIPLFLVSAPVISPLPAFVTLVTRMQSWYAFLDAFYARIVTDHWKVNSGFPFQEAATLCFLLCDSHASPSAPLRKQHFDPFQVL